MISDHTDHIVQIDHIGYCTQSNYLLESSGIFCIYQTMKLKTKDLASFIFSLPFYFFLYEESYVQYLAVSSEFHSKL